MAWYRTGTCSVTNGSPSVTGSGSAWIVNARQGDGFRGPDKAVYEILAVTADGAMTLAEDYGGASAAGAAYAIVPTQGYIRDLAQKTVQLQNDYSAMLTGPGAGRFASGTAVAPGIAFAASPSTGLSLPAPSLLGVSLGGTTCWQFSPSSFTGDQGGTSCDLSVNKIGWADPARSADNKRVECLWAGGVFFGRFLDDAAATAGASFIRATGGQASGVVTTELLTGSNEVTLRLSSGGNAYLPGAGKTYVNTTSDWTGQSKFIAYNNATTGRVISAHNGHDSTGGCYVARVEFPAAAFHEFFCAGTPVGYINTNGSATSYVSVSDVRLKENIVDAPDAGETIDLIRVVSHDWKGSAIGRTEFGVIAQELHHICPEAVAVGDDGVEVERPWGTDLSFLVPLLVKEIQSLRARAAALEST